jgi:hypothetical protein
VCCAADESDTSEMIPCLQVHASPESKVLDYCLKTVRIQLGFTHRPETPPVLVILQLWARYADENRHLLVGLIPLLSFCYTILLVSIFSVLHCTVAGDGLFDLDL